jgi:hypothetical protein
LQDGHGHADKVALSLRFQPNVIPFTGEILLSVDKRVAVGMPLVRPTGGATLNLPSPGINVRITE